MARDGERYATQARDLVKHLVAARKRAGLSQQRLAEAARISISTVRNLEQGVVKDPGFFEVVAMADAVGVSIEELASGPPR